jgi:S-formylglutathione hydrolase FrmB
LDFACWHLQWSALRFLKTKILVFLAVSLIASVIGWRISTRWRQRSPLADHPRLAAGVEMRDITFFSESLHRKMQYRVFAPAREGKQRLPVVYLLHGGGDEGLHSWSNDSDVAQFVSRGLLLVMPQGDYSYYVNAVLRAQDRYEDYIMNDLSVDVAQRFVVRDDRAGRAIAGVSMGGFGAVNTRQIPPNLMRLALAWRLFPFETKEALHVLNNRPRTCLDVAEYQEAAGDA